MELRSVSLRVHHHIVVGRLDAVLKVIDDIERLEALLCAADLQSFRIAHRRLAVLIALSLCDEVDTAFAVYYLLDLDPVGYIAVTWPRSIAIIRASD